MSSCNTCRNWSLRHTPSSRQLLLGASQDRQLCILPPSISVPGTHYSNAQNDLPLNKPFLTQLADEILYEIFAYALRSRWWRIAHQTGVRLSKVSRRFYHIVQPLMYRTVYFNRHNIVRPCRAVTKFHRTINENRALGSMVKVLFVHVETFGPALETDYTIGRELLGFFPNIESFSLHGGYGNPWTWPMIKNAVKSWPRIKYIQLSREDWSLLMPPVCELVMATPGLKTLNLYGVSASSQRSDNSDRVWSPPSPNIERTSNIINLTVDDFGDTPEALQNLLKLPKALEHFVFGKIHSNPVNWHLEMFQRLLADHRTTLKSIEIGSLGEGFTPINFIEFPNLEILNLSHWVYRETAKIASVSILAPSLHTFIWDFRIIDQHSESWSDFGEEQKKWLLEFAELAIERKSKLRKIKILFFPDTYEGPHTREELADCVTPWDLMDEVKDKIKPFGIEIEYTQNWTRESCLHRIEIIEKRAEEERSQNMEDETFSLNSDEALSSSEEES